MTDGAGVRVSRDGDIAWVTIENPPVNATSTAVRAGLVQAVADVQGARLAVLQGAGRCFVAGGDMTEFDRPAELPDLPDVVQIIEESPVPFLVLLHGLALGGGWEIAMGCDWRFALPGTQIGLPEVNVGLIPGAGGTQRAPRLIGMKAAVDMACKGRMFSAEQMLELGGIDQIVSGTDAVRAFAEHLPARPGPVRKRKVQALNAADFTTAKAALEKRAKGQRAPGHNLTALQWAALPFSEGQPKERALHLELRQSSESRALRYAFFAERRVSKPRAIAGYTAQHIENIVVIGGGLMGAGIAVACLGAGFRTTLIERSMGEAEAANTRVMGLLDGALKRGKITADTRATQAGLFAVSDSYAAAANADLAIEAVFEDAAVKSEVFQQLDAVMRADAILATNTSYLDPRDIFAGISNPARCLGLHFFSPAHVMKLLEIVQMPETSGNVLATGFAFGRKLKKVTVLSGICDGFVGNRMLAAYRREAEYLLADGALPHQVDAAMRSFGMPMGPFELQDLTGLQIAWANRKRQAATRAPTERYERIADSLCEMDRLGQRSGKGWYHYEGGARVPVRDPKVDALIIQYSADRGLTRREFSAAEITDRLLAVLANEGARIVEEGVAEGFADVDMVKLHGYGFPRWRGGPMHYAGQIGWDKTAATMAQVAQESPKSWVISDKVKGQIK